MVAGADDTLYPGQLSGPQSAVGLESRVHCALIAGHSTLQANRKCVHALRSILRNVSDESGRVRVGVKLRMLRRILENGVDHPHIHEQTFGDAAGVGWLPVEDPSA